MVELFVLVIVAMAMAGKKKDFEKNEEIGTLGEQGSYVGEKKLDN
jgi:hypothetical protein